MYVNQRWRFFIVCQCHVVSVTINYLSYSWLSTLQVYLLSQTHRQSHYKKEILIVDELIHSKEQLHMECYYNLEDPHLCCCQGTSCMHVLVKHRTMLEKIINVV